MEGFFKLLAATFVALAISAACNPLNDGPKRSDTENGMTDSGSGGLDSDTTAHLYVSAIAFPEGHDWRKDTPYGQSEGQILLFRDGERILELDAGKGDGPSTDPGRHHLIGGIIYSDHISGGKTVIVRNGEEICRYAPEEIIRGIVADKQYVYSLGQNRYGGGFSLRRNGIIVHSREEGTVTGDFSDFSYGYTGALYADCGKLCFSYFTEENGVRRWYNVTGSETREIMNLGTTHFIADTKVIDGHSWAVLSIKNGPSPVLMRDGNAINLYGSVRRETANDYRILRNGREICFVGSLSQSGSQLQSTGFWNSGRLFSSVSGDAWYARVDGNRIDHISTSRGKVAYSVFDGETDRPDGEYALMTAQCACWTEDGWVLGLSDKDAGGAPFIRRDGEMEALEINGFISGVWYGK